MNEAAEKTSAKTFEKANGRNRLMERQREIAEIYGINPNKLSGLEFCDICRGSGQLPLLDIGSIALNDMGFSIDEKDSDKSNRICGACSGTGIMFGGLELSAKEWIRVSEYTATIHENGKTQPNEEAQTDLDSRHKEERMLVELIRSFQGGRFTSRKPKQRGRVQKKR